MPVAADEAVQIAQPNRATRLTRRITLTARNYVLRDNLAFRAYDTARLVWFIVGKAGRTPAEPMPQRTFSSAERFAVPIVTVPGAGIPEIAAQ